MNILVTVITQLLNPYPLEIYEYLKVHKNTDCTYSNLKFWMPDFYHFDIIHIHWPSGLTTNLLNTDFIVGGNNFKSELFVVNECIKKWKAKKTKIVFTYHNENPHEGSDEFSSLLNEMVIQYSDAVVHLGQYSLQKYTSEYTIEGQKNMVIPHSIYISYPNTSTKEESRKMLGIGKNKFVILVFGSVRNAKEANFAMETFRQVNDKNKFLLAPRWNIEDFTKYGRILGFVKQKLFEINNFFKFNVRLKSNRTSVLAKDVQHYFNASDVVLLPRIDSINSGIMPLAATFKKALVGPDSGNMGEHIRNAGLKTFEPNHSKQASEIINEIVQQKSQYKIGEMFYQYAETNWNLKFVAEQHYALYQKLISE
jgi:glycosyltransferase involved in cell wall biosynthesis